MSGNYRGRFNGGRGYRGRGQGRGQFSNWRGADFQPHTFPAAQQLGRNTGEAASNAPQTSQQQQTGPKNVKKDNKKEDVTESIKPKALSTTNTAEKNDPLISDSVLIDGVNGFVERTRQRHFQLDYSAYISLVRASYDAQVTFDRGFRKYVSYGMYQYYAVILLWRRLLYVTSQRGQRAIDYERLIKYLNFEIPEPSDIAMYLNSIGDIIDFSSRHFILELQTYFAPLRVGGIQGTFGQITAQTAIFYETIPSIYVALEKIRQDLLHTVDNADADWDLPEEVRPLEAGAVLPNANLLGWFRSETLTTEQQTAYADANITDDEFGTIDVARMPINQVLVRYVAGQIENSKCKAVSPMSTSVTGSLGQIPFGVRTNDNHVEIVRSIAMKMITNVCYSQAPPNTALLLQRTAEDSWLPPTDALKVINRRRNGSPRRRTKPAPKRGGAI